MTPPLDATTHGPLACAEAACGQVLERLEAYVDGELDAAEVAAIEAHCELCPACDAERRLASSIRQELRALPELDAPPSVLREITMEAERARFRGARHVFAHRRVWARLAAAALATMVLGASLWWGTSRQAPPVEIADVDPAGDVDPAVIAQATEEARYALAYLTRVNRRAGLKLRDDLFVERVARPTVRGLSRSLSRHLDIDAASHTDDSRRDRS